MSLLDLYDKRFSSGGPASSSSLGSPYSRPDTSASAFGTLTGSSGGSGGSGAAASSQERGAPERFDINSFVTDWSNPEQKGLQALEVAGRAPGFALERPIAAAGALAKDATGFDLGQAIGSVPVLGQLVGGLGAGFQRLESIIPALGNAAIATQLQQGAKEGWAPDRQVVYTDGWAQLMANNPITAPLAGLLGMKPQELMTWGEFQKRAQGRGFTDQDVQDLSSGAKAPWDFGDKSTSDSALGDAALRMVADPLNLLFGLGAAAKVPAGLGLLGKAVQAGAELEKPLEVSRAIDAVAQANGVGATWRGVAGFFGQIGRGIGAVPGGEALVGAGAKGLSAAGQAGSLYKKAAYATTAANVGIEAAYQAMGRPTSGFLEPLFQINQQVFDNQPLSQDQIFSLWSAFHVGPHTLLKPVVRGVKAAVRAVDTASTRGAFLDAMSEGMTGTRSENHASVIATLGGEDQLNNLIYHAKSRVAAQQILRNPALKAALSVGDSLDERVLANSKLQELVDDQIANVSTRDAVQSLRDWYANRSGVKQSVEFPWDGEAAAQRWNDYTTAAAPVSEVFQQRAAAVVGLADHLTQMDLEVIRQSLRTKAVDGQVPIRDVRRVMSRYPQLLELGKGEWQSYLTRDMDGSSVPMQSLHRQIGKAIKQAPTLREVTAEQAAAEAAAARTEADRPAPPAPREAALTQLAVSDRAAERALAGGSATVTASRMTDKVKADLSRRFGLDSATVGGVMASRADARISKFEEHVGETLVDHGFAVEDVTQSTGLWEGKTEPSVEISLQNPTLGDLRLAAATLGKVGEQDAVALSVTGQHIVDLGLEPNGVEVVWALPSNDRALMEQVNAILREHFTGATLNDTTGVVRVLLPGDELRSAEPRTWYSGEEASGPDLAAVHAKLEALLPRDAIGDTGLRSSIHKAYIEFPGREGDLTYDGIIRQARADGDPRARAYLSARDQLSYKAPARGVARPADRPAPAVGRAPGDDGLSARDLTQPPAERVGIGSRDSIAPEPGFLYRTLSADALRLAAEDGIRTNPPLAGTTHPDGGTGARNYFSRDLSLLDAGDAVVRMPEAGSRIANDAASTMPYLRRRVRPSELEVWGGDGQWHPLDEFYQSPVDPVTAKAAQEVAPAYDPAAQEAATAGMQGLAPPVRPDPLTVGLRAMEDRGRPNLEMDEVGLRAELAKLTAKTTLTPEEAAAAQDVQRRLEAAVLAKGERRRMGVLYAAQRDAQVARSIPLHRSLEDMPAEVRPELEQLQRDLSAHYGPYVLKAPPKLAQFYDAHQGDLVAEHLRAQNGVANAVANWGAFGKVNRVIEWLTQPVRNSELGRAATQALYNELIPHGATPKEVKTFLARLNQEAHVHTIGPFEVQTFRNGTSLTQQAINKIAAGDPLAGLSPVFSEKVIASVGRDGFARALDRAGNRFYRAADEIAGGDGPRAGLARAFTKTYDAYQKTWMGSSQRYVSKTMYHWFRFLSDPRWWAMNMLEADMLGGMRYGSSATRLEGAHQAPQSAATLAHELGDAAAPAMASNDTGWLYTRRLGGYISRAFDHERPESTLEALRGLAQDDPILRELQQRFGTAEDDIVAGIDRMLYSWDTKGPRATLSDEARATLGADEALRLAPFLDKVWQRHEQLFSDIKQVFHGNPDRSNLERIANSYWLYWPLSYQVKATKWLVDTLTNRMFGKQTNLAGAAMYAHVYEEHQRRMASDPEYAKMFSDHPTLWFLAQMMIPITPGDMGVSLSRPLRYAGGALGIWGQYKSAQDPVTAAGAVLSLGPAYSAELMSRIGGELFKGTTANMYPTSAADSSFSPYEGAGVN